MQAIVCCQASAGQVIQGLVGRLLPGQVQGGPNRLTTGQRGLAAGRYLAHCRQGLWKLGKTLRHLGGREPVLARGGLWHVIQGAVALNSPQEPQPGRVLRVQAINWLHGHRAQPQALAQGDERTLTMTPDTAQTGATPSAATRAAAANKGAPEEIIARAMAAALDKDEAVGWRRFAELLHPSQTSAQSLASWRRYNFAAFRRKVHLYLPEDRSIRFEVDYTEDRGEGRVKLFIENRKSDMPTPCQLRKDAEGRWRIEVCSL